MIFYFNIYYCLVFSTERGSKYDLVTKGICKDQQPLSLVDGEGFKYLTKILRSCYLVPSRKNITELLDLPYDLIKATYQKHLKVLSTYCLTAYLWINC